MTPVEARLREAIRIFQVEFAKAQNSQATESFLAAVAQFRSEVEEAAAAGVEDWRVWHMVALSSLEPYDRIHCFSRALKAMDRLAVNHRHPSENFFRADCLAHIAAAHQKQGCNDLARKFYEEALPLARASSDQHGDAITVGSGPSSVEGRIAAALLLLDAEE